MFDVDMGREASKRNGLLTGCAGFGVAGQRCGAGSDPGCVADHVRPRGRLVASAGVRQLMPLSCDHGRVPRHEVLHGGAPGCSDKAR